MQQQPNTMPDITFSSLDDKIVPPDKCPTVREIILQSVRANPGAALQALKQCEATPVAERQPLGLNHTLNLGIPASLFLELSDEMKALAREVMGL